MRNNGEVLRAFGSKAGYGIASISSQMGLPPDGGQRSWNNSLSVCRMVARAGVLPEYDSPVYPVGGAFRVLAGKEASFLARSHVLRG